MAGVAWPRHDVFLHSIHYTKGGPSLFLVNTNIRK